MTFSDGKSWKQIMKDNVNFVSKSIQLYEVSSSTIKAKGKFSSAFKKHVVSFFLDSNKITYEQKTPIVSQWNMFVRDFNGLVIIPNKHIFGNHSEFSVTENNFYQIKNNIENS